MFVPTSLGTLLPSIMRVWPVRLTFYVIKASKNALHCGANWIKQWCEREKSNRQIRY